MATTDAHPLISLSHIGHDDDMELSSDHGRYDGDFDIDIDQGGDYAGDADLDQMQEDLRSDRGMTDLLDPSEVHANDDEMAEGSIDGRDEPQDGIMQVGETTTELNDEDLEDYIGDESEYARERSNEIQGPETVGEQEDTTYTEDIGDTTLKPDEHVDAVDEALKQDQIEESNDTARSGHNQNEMLPPTDTGLPTSHSPANEDQQQETESQNSESTVLKSTKSHDSSDPNSQTDTADALAHHQEEHNVDNEYQKNDVVHSVAELGEKAVDDVEHNDELGEAESQAMVDESLQPSHEHHAGSFTVTGLHPTIVRYEGSEVSLFPSGDPSSQEEYFLEDENIVNGSIGDMLEACRVVLGDNISEDEELELTVEELGLSLSEDSTPAFSASFSEILQLYVQLQALDGVAQPPPMYMTLSTKTRFTNRLTLLAHAISEGRGLSSIPPAKEMMYDEEETFTEYHEYEDGDQEDGHDGDGENEVDAAQYRQPTEDSEQGEETQPPDDGTLDQLHAVATHEHYQKGEDETAGLEQHSAEQKSEWEESNVEEVPADVEEAAIAADPQPSMGQSNVESGDVDRNETLDTTTSAGGDVATSAEKRDSDDTAGELLAAEDAEDNHTIFDDEQTGDSATSNQTDRTASQPDEIDFGDDSEVQNPLFKSDTSREVKKEVHSAQGSIATGVEQEQDDFVQPVTNNAADDDLPPVPEDDLDDIDFDDDDEIDNDTETKTTSLKRSFTEHNEDEATPNDDQDAKRARP